MKLNKNFNLGRLKQISHILALSVLPTIIIGSTISATTRRTPSPPRTTSSPKLSNLRPTSSPGNITTPTIIVTGDGESSKLIRKGSSGLLPSPIIVGSAKLLPSPHPKAKSVNDLIKK